MIGHQSARKFAFGDVMVEGMGLKMPFGEMMERCWRWACRCHQKMIVELNLKEKLNKYQNSVCDWSVSELYLKIGSE